MTKAEKTPKYRAGDTVLCKGKVERSDHDDSVYVRFAASRECPQLKAADIVALSRPMIRMNDRVSWPAERTIEGGMRRTGEVVGINHDDTLGLADPRVWLWIKEDGKWPRVTIEAGEVTRL